MFDPFARAIDGVFERLGQSARYHPIGGEPKSIRLLAQRSDAMLDIGHAEVLVETPSFEVRRAEVADPRIGDQILVGDRTYEVCAEPERRGGDRLIWTLEARPL